MENLTTIEETLDVIGFGEETALHLAVIMNDKVAISLLAEVGANLRVRNANEKNHLDEAYCKRNYDISKVLLVQRRRFDSVYCYLLDWFCLIRSKVKFSGTCS